MESLESKDNEHLPPEGAEALLYLLLGRSPAENSQETDWLTRHSFLGACRLLLAKKEFWRRIFLVVIAGRELRHEGLPADHVAPLSSILTSLGVLHSDGQTWPDFLFHFYSCPPVKALLESTLPDGRADHFRQMLISPAPVIGDTSLGQITCRRAEEISGWVLPATPDLPPRTLDILLNGKGVARVTANRLRLATDRKCGFEASIPIAEMSAHEGPQYISLCDAGSGGLLFPPFRPAPTGAGPLAEVLDIQRQSQSAEGTEKETLRNQLRCLLSASNFALRDYDSFVRHTEPAMPTTDAFTDAFTLIPMEESYPTKDYLKEAKRLKEPYLIFMPDGACLSPASPTLIAEAATTNPDADVLYTDHDYITTDTGRYERPVLKAAFDYDYFLATGYVGPAFAVRRSAFIDIGGFDPTFGMAASDDLLLRLFERGGARCFRHVPRALWHCPVSQSENKTPRLNHRCAAVRAHLKRTQTPASVALPPDTMSTASPGTLTLDWTIAEDKAKDATLAIIIPTRDRADLLETCISSLRSTLAAPNQTEIIVVDNDSREDKTRAYLETLSKSGMATVIPFAGAFNWSAQNNLAASQTRADMLLFLNNDTLTTEYGWDLRLRGYLGRKDVGIVGARLLFEDGTLQHAGVTFYRGCRGWMEALGDAPENGLYMNRTQLDHSTGAVIGAFMAMRREVFNDVGGFDDTDLAVTYNDYDMCLKVRDKGLRCLYTPSLTFVHRGWQSRGTADFHEPVQMDRAAREFDILQNRYAHLAPIDPDYPPAFAQDGRPYHRLDAFFRLHGSDYTNVSVSDI